MVGLAWANCRRKRKPGKKKKVTGGVPGALLLSSTLQTPCGDRVESNRCNHPATLEPDLVVASAWQALAGWQAGQRRSGSLQAET